MEAKEPGGASLDMRAAVSKPRRAGISQTLGARLGRGSWLSRVHRGLKRPLLSNLGGKPLPPPELQDLIVVQQPATDVAHAGAIRTAKRQAHLDRLTEAEERFAIDIVIFVFGHDNPD